MIEDLRKQLDDVMFKRGAHFKRNDRVHKPTFVDNVTIPRQITDQISLPLSQNKHESAETESSYNPTKNSNLSKSTLTPLTVFGERLLKRIAEEQSMEKRGKQPSKFGCNNSCVPTIEGYVVESDKENGSVTDVKPSRTKEMQLSAVEEYSEKERFTATNCLAEGRNEMDSNVRFQQKRKHITDIVDIADGEKNDGTDRTMNIKCVEFEVKERALRSTNKEPREDVNNVFDKRHEHTKTKRFEGSEKYSDSRYITYSNTERNRSSSVQESGKKRSHRVTTVAGQPSQNDADERVAKRHCKSAERLSITMDDYRSNSVECRRIKQREDRRTTEPWGDRRSRRRQSFCESSRDEKYTRSKSNKYNDYRERSVRRYDTNSDSADGSRSAAKRESRDSRNIEKSEKYARSTNKRSARSEDYEYQPKERLKDVDRRQYRTRYCETFKSEKAIDINKSIERSDRRRFAGNYETPSICSSNGKRREKSQDRWTNGDKPESPVISTDETNANIVIRAATPTTNAVATCIATVVSLDEQYCENIGHVENETVENVENIEKFIRNYNASDVHHPKDSLDERNDTSKIAKEHGPTTNHVFKGETNFEEQPDTIRSDDVKPAEMNTKLEAVESNDALQQVFQGSVQNDTKENETTVAPSPVEHTKSKQVLESNSLIDLPADKASTNLRTDAALSNTNATCNISSSNTFQISKPGCNGNVNGDADGDSNDDEGGNDKDNDKTRSRTVSRDVEADRTNSNCDYSVPDSITKGIDDDCDRNNESDGNIKIHMKTNENDHKTVRNKKGTSKENDRANLAEKLDEKIENEESKVNKEQKENGIAVTEQGSREMEKSSINCNGTNRKKTSTNVHGKIIVLVRRKKPVCLANNNANMTVLINNSQNLNNS
ncbi:FLICE-associated huge protein isoform X2 [Halictus rubicundus]